MSIVVETSPPDESPEPDGVWPILAQAFRHMFWPFIFVLIDIQLGFNEIKIDILPDFVGWLWLAGAMLPLTSRVPLAQTMRTIAFLLAALSLVTWVDFPDVNQPTVNGIQLTRTEMTPWGWFSSTVGSIQELLHALFVWLIVGLMMKVTSIAPESGWFAHLRRLRIVYASITVVALFAPLLPFANTVTIIVVALAYCLIAIIYALVLLASIRGVTWFCEQRAHSASAATPNLHGKENSILENALLPSDNRQGKFRFTLFNLVLLITVIGMASSQIRLIWSAGDDSRRVAEAEEIAEFYKSKLNHIYVRDDSKIYCRAVPTPDVWHSDEESWEWRVHVPEEGHYRIRMLTSQIPQTGIPEPLPGSVDLLGGQSTVRVTLSPEAGEHGIVKVTTTWDDPNRRRSYISTNGRMKEITEVYSDEEVYELKANEVPYVGGSGGCVSEGVLPSEDTTTFDADSEVLLLRKRISVSTGPNSSGPSPSPSQGLMIWIEKRDF